jgi:SNF2-related domain
MQTLVCRPPSFSPFFLPRANFSSTAEAVWIGEAFDEPAGALIDTRKEYTTSLAGCFDRIVLDEGHKVKNPQTLVSNMVKLLRAPRTWILTATPMMNRATDYVGYLHLLWRDDMAMDPQDYPDSDKELYTDDNLVPKQSPLYAPGGRYDFEAHSLPLWRLDPYRFKHIMIERQVDITALVAFEVLRGITQMTTLRRTQATVLEANGEQVRIGNSIPRYQICTVEVDFENDRAFREYQRRFRVLSKSLANKLPKQSSTPRKFMAPRTDSSNPTGRNFGIHRRLSLATFNMGLDQMIKKVSLNLAADVDRWYHMNRDGGMSLYFRATRPVPNTPSYPDRFSFGMYLAKDSPKLQYMAGLVGKICRGDDPERVLIYGDYPMPHWNIEGFLKVSPSDSSLAS